MSRASASDTCDLSRAASRRRRHVAALGSVLAVLAALVVVLVLVGLGVEDGGTLSAGLATAAAASGRPSATASSGPTAAQNQADAQAEADQVVSMATLPPGAGRVTVQPVSLTGPAMGTPGTSHLIDSIAYYTVPMPVSQAHAWFDAHTPQGFTQSGTMTGGGPANLTVYGFEYNLSPSPHWSWGSANLEIALASHAPATTGIRVDGVSQWIDPSPVRVTSPGPAIRVTISGGCPMTDRGWNDVSNRDAPDLDHQLLPAEAPTEALKCTYDGMNGKPFMLVSSQHLNATQAPAAAALIRALPLGSRGITTINCPMDDSRASILVFGYPERADIDVWEHTSGCSYTDNGHIVASWF